jgi:8-oxo-dGTP diphosphatase
VTYRERQRLADIQAAIDAIRSHLQRGDLSDGLVFDAVRIRLLEIGEAVKALARKRMAAGALFRDEDGRVLLVNPTYKPTWDLPGGAVEKEESPHAACRREVAEELGLDRVPGRVLVVDWVPSRPERPEGLIVVYDGGVLAPGEVAAITLQDGELGGYEFVKPGEVAERVSPLLARRISACVDAVAAGTVISLEDGCPVT